MPALSDAAVAWAATAAAAAAVLVAGCLWLRLRRLRGELRQRDRLLADASHEVRTPLSAIVGFARELRDHDLQGEDRSRAADAILRNGEHVLQLVAGLLDWSRFEAGVLQPEARAIELATFLQETLDNFRPQAREQGVILRLEVGEDLPSHVELDPLRVRQVLWNLLANALRFTAEGAVALRARREGAGGDRLCLEVQDSGPGMTREQVGAVFGRFQQVCDDPDQRRSGFGLGLAISQQLCAALGGALCADSAPGAGSRFWFTLPLRSAQGPDPAGPEAGPAPLRVLLADDGADHRVLLSAILSRAGATVVPVRDGRRALSAYRSALATGPPFDAVILDVQMPGMDGAEAAATLRREGFTGRLLALTADARTRRARRCRTAGCDEVLEKPVRSETLLAALRAGR